MSENLLVRKPHQVEQPLTWICVFGANPAGSVCVFGGICVDVVSDEAVADDCERSLEPAFSLVDRILKSAARSGLVEQSGT